jgi:hypothetical protein
MEELLGSSLYYRSSFNSYMTLGNPEVELPYL